MNYLKKIDKVKLFRRIIGIMAGVGFFILIGTVGNNDYYDEIHVYHNIFDDIPMLLLGMGLMLPAFFLFGNEDFEDEDD